MIPSTTRRALATASVRPNICQSCLRYSRHPFLATEKRSAPSSSHLLHTSRESPSDDAPFRKVLKDAAKKSKKEKKANSDQSTKSHKAKASVADKWELTVGIEIHAELNTAQKLFSSAATSVNQAPNTHVALFDMAFPGSQPHFQKQTLVPALRAALALNCNIQHKSSFDRKHYFYQDQPNGYQITQFYGKFPGPY